MNTAYSRISIRSSNPDCNGTWKKSDVETELRGLGYAPAGDDWLDYILTNVFDGPDDLSGLFKLVAAGRIANATFRYNGRLVAIEMSR